MFNKFYINNNFTLKKILNRKNYKIFNYYSSSRNISLKNYNNSNIHQALKDKIPDLPITLFSIEEVNSQVFKKVILINNLQYGWIDKIEYIPQTPSEETLLIYRY